MSTDIERELERTTQMRGFRYGLHDFVAQLGGAEALKKVNDHVAANYLKQGLVDRKTKELVIIAALVALKDRISHIQVHMHAAHKAGATPEEIMEVLTLVGGDIGNVAKQNALEAWRVTFRPDLPTIDRVVELR